MRIDLSQTSHVLFFVVFLPAISFGIGWGFTQVLPNNAPFWVETISPLGAYALLYSFFEQVAWHWPIFRLAGIVDAPDLRGRWEGVQISSYKDDKGEPIKLPIVIEIDQSFSQVEARAFYQRWNDGHRASSFLEIDGKLHLVSIFESDPNAKHDGRDRAHKGVLRLQYTKEGDVLSGNYFNNFGNHGDMQLHRTGSELLGRFAADTPQT